LLELDAATEADYPAVVDLANVAFRGSGADAGWNSEADYIAGPRLTESLLRADLASNPGTQLLVYRDHPGGPLLGTVLLGPRDNDVWYLGLVTVRPDLQNRRWGGALLAAAENFAKERGARCIRMTVVNVRATLIAWYQRRGYALTGETQPFPYDDRRFGVPLRDDLSFVVLERDI